MKRRSGTERPPPLQTIGYEGRTLDDFLRSLTGAGVTLLCDIRRNPISRKPGFSKKRLATRCEEVGIRYEHLPELGIASEKRKGVRTRAQYDALFADYARKWLPRQTESLERIEGWIAAGERVALMCFERLAEDCHRHCVVEALASRTGRSRAVRHI